MTYQFQRSKYGTKIITKDRINRKRDHRRNGLKRKNFKMECIVKINYESLKTRSFVQLGLGKRKY